MSYLSDRSQQVKCNSQISTSLPVRIGVPQGSILGPVLFILYINDLPISFKNCNSNNYADDTLDCRGKTINDVETCLQLNLNIASNWLTNNRLLANASKSKVMLMGSKLSVKNAKLNITLNSTPLEQVHDVKLLGLNIDENINWKLILILFHVHNQVRLACCID